MKEKLPLILTAVTVFLLASFFRFYGLNWDQNQHLHPDERFLTMVAGGISWPDSIIEYLDTASSPLNPHNRNFGFFVYGSFPVFFTKYVAENLGKGDYINLTLVGRRLSALFDLGTVVLVYLIANQIYQSRLLNLSQIQNQKSKLNPETKPLKHIPLLAMFLYSCLVLPIQLSHFFAVDTYLTFFITGSFLLLVKIISWENKFLKTNLLISAAALGFFFGLALSSKISALLFLPFILFGFFIFLIKQKDIYKFLFVCLIFLAASFLTFRFAQPYAFASSKIISFKLNPKLLDNWKQLKSFDDPKGFFPPAVQWIKTKPYLFPLKNMVLWGLGLPIGSISILSIVYYVLSITKLIIRKKSYLLLNTYYIILSLSVLWIILVFGYQGGQFVKALRYFFPFYPFLAIISAWFLSNIFQMIKKAANKKIYLLTAILLLVSVLIYPISFISIYTRLHTRIAASEWIYNHIPAGAKLSAEHWDDGLPLSLPKEGYQMEKYKMVEFPLYWPEEKEKWEKMNQALSQVDYIVISSNRLYGSIMTVPEKYPLTYRFYQLLFNNSLGFKKVAEFTSRPHLPLPFLKICLTPPFAHYGAVAKTDSKCDLDGLSFVDDYADETFTVYDHPKVIIFQKIKPVDYLDILAKNGSKE